VAGSRSSSLGDELTIAQHIAHIHGAAGVEFGDDIAELREFVPQILGDSAVERLLRAASAGVVLVAGDVRAECGFGSRRG
jgi:hypothetical protein